MYYVFQKKFINTVNNIYRINYLIKLLKNLLIFQVFINYGENMILYLYWLLWKKVMIWVLKLKNIVKKIIYNIKK